MAPRSAPLIDVDLLEPALGPRDDTAGFRGRPWNPWTLVVWSAFAGHAGAALLFALNAYRLGSRRGATALAALFLALAVLHEWLLVTLEAPERGLGLTRNFLTLVAAAVVSTLQQRRFHLYAASGGESGSSVPVGVAAVAVGIAAHQGLRWALAAATGGLP